MHNYDARVSIRDCWFYNKGGTPTVPNPPPPPKPPSQQQAGGTADANLAAQRKKQGYASTLLGGFSPNAMQPIQANGKTLLGG